MIYLLISLRLALPGSTTEPRQKRGRALSSEAHHRPLFFFFFSLFSLTLLLSFFFSLVWVVLGSVRGYPSTALYWGIGYPMATSSNPFPLPLPYLCIFLGGAGLRLSKIYHGPVRKDPSLLVRGDGGFWVVCFLGTHALSPVRGSGISQESGEVVASYWGFASPWPPSPFPDYFP